MEFINDHISKYLNDNNIKMINGKPYKTRSQGVVERVHRTIRNGLIVKYIENVKKFNLDLSLKIVVNNYNRTVHSVTKFQPNEIFYSTDNELFKKVYNNILDYYNKTQKNNFSYSINTKCLLNNNIIKSKKKVKNKIMLLNNSIKKNKSFYKVCVKIQENLNGGLYLIKIAGDYDFIGIKNNEIYCVNFNLLIPCNSDIWDQLYLYNCNNSPLVEENEDIIDTSDSELDEENKSEESVESSENEILNKKKYVRSKSF